jgi:hypothetical protein
MCRFSDAMYELQESTAPARLRLEAITNMQVDGLWQRDLRVYRTNAGKVFISICTHSFPSGGIIAP